MTAYPRTLLDMAISSSLNPSGQYLSLSAINSA